LTQSRHRRVNDQNRSVADVQSAINIEVEMGKLNLGDMIAIPSGDRFGLAKIIYSSEYFKSVVLIRLFLVTYQNTNIVDFPGMEEKADLYYTSSDPVSKGLWTKVGSQPVLEDEALMSKRTVGGDVWIADECLGAASDRELKDLPKMLTYGHRLIEKAISRLPIPMSE